MSKEKQNLGYEYDISLTPEENHKLEMEHLSSADTKMSDVQIRGTTFGEDGTHRTSSFKHHNRDDVPGATDS